MTAPEPPGAWRKSSYSANTDNCVEVAAGAKTLVRDTKDRERSQLSVSAHTWRTFLTTVKDGGFDI
jgi:hypothetical protein